MRGFRIGGHPVHPAIVHFPIAGWTTACVGDGLYWLNGDVQWWALAYWAMVAGVVSGVVAMAVGMLELMAIPEGHPAWRSANLHAGLMACSWTVFTINLVLRDVHAPAAPPFLWLLMALSLSGMVLLVLGGYQGARLVYDHGIGGRLAKAPRL
jgi:uncharacterized membrane protein